MEKITKEEWSSALRSGEYKQVRKILCDDTGFCCLGVLGKLYEKKGIGKFDGHEFVFGETECDETGDVVPATFEDQTPEELLCDGVPLNNSHFMALNDNLQMTFEEIADVIDSGKSMNLINVERFFYNKKNDSNYTFEQVMEWGWEQWEVSHDFIQWLFPTDTESSYNSSAPVLTKGEFEVLAKDLHISGCILRARNKFISIYMATDGPAHDYFSNANNHNHRRTTRLLRCLKSLGLSQGYVFDMLHLLKDLKELKTTPETWNYWCDALKDQ